MVLTIEGALKRGIKEEIEGEQERWQQDGEGMEEMWNITSIRNPCDKQKKSLISNFK